MTELLTFDRLQSMKLPKVMHNSRNGCYTKAADYPFVMHMALRANGVWSSKIAEIFGCKDSKVKHWANKLGLVDSSTKLCASGPHHKQWKGYSDWGNYWANEKKELSRATKAASWNQHELSMQWEWRHKHQKRIADPEKKKAWLQAAERYRRKLGQRPRQEYVDSIRIHKETIKLRECLRDNTVGAYKRGADRFIPWLGCSGKQLREWLERQFKGHMTHDNYGKCWSIDHIVPLASFDLSDPDQYAMAANFNNLQPLYCKANSNKGTTTDGQLGLILQVIDA